MSLIRRLRSVDAGFDAALDALLRYDSATDAAVESAVQHIIADVRARGDAALLELTARFDGLQAASMTELEIGRAELRSAFDGLPAEQRSALQTAAGRIRSYHEYQLLSCGRGFSYRDADGTLLGQKVTPIDRAGIYVPGGKAAYPSSVLMNALPAAVAGVPEIVMVVPAPQGQRNPLVLAAAHLAGAARVFTIGGAQAVAALAYGTASVPRVDKITGPGNAYVAAAKRRVFGQVGIDMIAGPSEILVVADGSTPAEWVAMDLFSQAEHDELAQSLLLSPDAAYLDAVEAAIERLLPAMPRARVIQASLQGRGALIQARSLEEACAIANRIAPEHLEISTRSPERWEPLLRHAGALFFGPFTSESLGDYCAGPNHVLPTAGTARFSSPLSVMDFQKRTSLIGVSTRGAAALGPVAATLADGEGFSAHAEAARLRLGKAAATAAEAPAAASGFNVRAVNADNMNELMKLSVGDGQKDYVAPNAWSVAQAAYRAPGRPLGLYDGDVPVGYLQLWDARLDPEDPADQLYVWRLMVDRQHQRKGYGRLAMRWVIDEARRMGRPQVGLSHVEANAEAAAFYVSLGFRYTGKIEHGEREMVLDLASDSPPDVRGT